VGMLKKAASGVLTILPCSRTHLYAPRAKTPAPLPEERHVLACTGWAGEEADLLLVFFSKGSMTDSLRVDR